MFTLMAYLETHSQNTLLSVVAVGSNNKRKTGQLQRRKGTELKHTFWYIIVFFSDWSRQSQTHPRSFRLSRFIGLRKAVGHCKVYYCMECSESVFWSVSQGSDCLWIQVARAKWQHPGATACNRSGNDLREYNKVLPHPPPWPTALITLALNLYFISKRHPNSQVDGRYGVWVIYGRMACTSGHQYYFS